jgi:hypothetical protein
MENDSWKKHLHKASSKSSLETSEIFFNEELIVCNIAVEDATYVMQDIETTDYCSPVMEDGQLDDLNSKMDLIESLTNQEGPLKADPCKEDHVMSNDKKTDDAGLDNWLEL